MVGVLGCWGVGELESWRVGLGCWVGVSRGVVRGVGCSHPTFTALTHPSPPSPTYLPIEPHLSHGFPQLLLLLSHHEGELNHEVEREHDVKEARTCGGWWAVGSGWWAMRGGRWAVGGGRCAVGGGRWAVGDERWVWVVGRTQRTQRTHRSPS